MAPAPAKFYQTIPGRAGGSMPNLFHHSPICFQLPRVSLMIARSCRIRRIVTYGNRQLRNDRPSSLAMDSFKIPSGSFPNTLFCTVNYGRLLLLDAQLVNLISIMKVDLTLSHSC